MGVVGTVFAAGVAGFFVQWNQNSTQAAVTRTRLEIIQQTVSKIEERMDAYQAGVGDRWTQTDHNAYAREVDVKFNRLSNALRDHERLEGHGQGMGQIHDLQRRIENTEATLRELQKGK